MTGFRFTKSMKWNRKVKPQESMNSRQARKDEHWTQEWQKYTHTLRANGDYKWDRSTQLRQSQVRKYSWIQDMDDNYVKLSKQQ